MANSDNTNEHKRYIDGLMMSKIESLAKSFDEMTNNIKDIDFKIENKINALQNKVYIMWGIGIAIFALLEFTIKYIYKG
ncbi:MAG: hypothetical protein ACYDDA_05800 [Acidiferrobacteraceae bacterium]